MEANWKRIWCLLAIAGPKTIHMHTYFWLGLASASPFSCHALQFGEGLLVLSKQKTVWWRTGARDMVRCGTWTWTQMCIGGVHLVVILSLFQIMIGNLVYRIMVMLMAAKPKPGIGSGSEVDCRCSTHFTIDRARHSAFKRKHSGQASAAARVIKAETHQNLSKIADY
jgi:hypothetical protein